MEKSGIKETLFSFCASSSHPLPSSPQSCYVLNREAMDLLGGEDLLYYWIKALEEEVKS